ncbi:acetyltransferase, GNAT family [Candidatus Rhodobacter oscarellae]|uniref:Acetyltransferase, GNAT family n=2 Tax=Candidatus Rhodobacter oscarellae TaxID=1675527 RepID=A0A0J9E598_9RHOB|nr:acetyltransferase, GNAT family [Candidatus Rhodobacter lobularis]
MRVTGAVGRPTGLCVVKGAELEQLYVDARARRQGVARELCKDAEARIREAGHALAFLACAIGNSRARAFYEAQGWALAGNKEVLLETAEVPFPLTVWRFEKPL